MVFVVGAFVLSGVYAVTGLVERTSRLRFRQLPSPRPHLATDLAWYAVAVGASAIGVFLVRPVLTVLTIGPAAAAIERLPGALQFAGAFIGFDLVSFVIHRRMHRSDRLWAIHKVHHSSQSLDGLATTRAHMLENVVRFFPAQAVFVVIGFPAPAITEAVVVAAVFGVSNHSNLGLDLRGIERVFVTPRLHRRHHVPRTTQTNFGTVLTLWDRLAGTMLAADTAPDERFGVPGEVDTYPQRFADAVRAPLREIRSGRALDGESAEFAGHADAGGAAHVLAERRAGLEA